MSCRRRPKNIKQALPSIGRMIRKFWPQIRQQRRLLTVSFLALLGETVFRLLEPWPLKFMFDELIFKGFKVENGVIPWLNELSPLALLSILALGFVAIAALRGGASYLSTVGMAIAATEVMTEVRGHLYAHLQRLSLAFHNKAKSGDLITRVTYDIARLREVAVLAALPLFTNILTMIGMVAVMFWLNWQLALVALAIAPVLVLITLPFSRRLRRECRARNTRRPAPAGHDARGVQR